VLSLIRQLHDEGSTICMVTHDPRSVESVARHIEMLDGEIVADSARQARALRVGV
jgi:putative ABC transport system ATP-binding protein